MSRSIKFAPKEYYHLYNRGTEKRQIFSSDADRERFLTLLYLSNDSAPVRIDNLMQQAHQQGRTLLEVALASERGELLVDLCAYCLMPNHFHLLVRERSNDGISRFMQKLTTGYTMYFNTRRERTGSLFQGKFKAEHAKDNRYLKYLISYIHLNPVKLIESKWKETGITKRKRAEMFLEQYPWSSFSDYCGMQRPEEILINSSALPTYHETPHDFKESVTEWLGYKKSS